MGLPPSPGEPAAAARPHLVFVYLGPDVRHLSWAAVDCLADELGRGAVPDVPPADQRPPYPAAVELRFWDVPAELEEATLAALARIRSGTGSVTVTTASQPSAPDASAGMGGRPPALVAFSANRAADVLQTAERDRTVEVRPHGTDLRREAVVHELDRLYELTGRLRRECPWDRRQTQSDIVAYTLEETYELVDAVRAPRADPDTVRSELGDLLFQVYFLAQVAEESGLYHLGGVAAGIHNKLVRRHPHIFGDVQVETPEDVRRNWDAIKRESEGREGIFHDVPEAFPAMLLAQKLQQRAAAVGFDWDRAVEILDKLREETHELSAEMGRSSEASVSADARPGALARSGSESTAAGLRTEIGDLLFTVVNLARKLRVDPELALREASQRFRARVEAAACAAAADGKAFEGLELMEKELYYQRAKQHLREIGDESGQPDEEASR